MRLFVDECFPNAFVQLLSAQGHDVVWARIICPGASDAELLATATTDGRVVVTEDRDFGSLIFRDGNVAVGVVSLYASQFPGGINVCAAQLAAQISENGDALLGAFPVIEPGRIRATPLPVRP